MEKFLEILQNPAVVSVVALLLESLMRLKQTEKPMSFLHVGVGILKKAVSIAEAIAAFFDKVLPQRVEQGVIGKK